MVLRTDNHGSGVGHNVLDTRPLVGWPCWQGGKGGCDTEAEGVHFW